MYKTAAGIACPYEVWKFYVESLMDKENARDIIKKIIIVNNNNLDAIEKLKNILQYRPDLISYLEKLLILT